MYLQIRDYTRTHYHSYRDTYSSLLVRYLFVNIGPGRKLSHFYESLQAIKPPNMSEIKAALEDDMKTQIPIPHLGRQPGRSEFLLC